MSNTWSTFGIIVPLRNGLCNEYPVLLPLEWPSFCLMFPYLLIPFRCLFSLKFFRPRQLANPWEVSARWDCAARIRRPAYRRWVHSASQATQHRFVLARTWCSLISHATNLREESHLSLVADHSGPWEGQFPGISSNVCSIFHPFRIHRVFWPATSLIRLRFCHPGLPQSLLCLSVLQKVR